MGNEWLNNLRIKLKNFYTEFDRVCRECGRSPKNIQILFATKYLSKEQFVVFIGTMKEFGDGKILIGENRVQDAVEKFSLERRDLANIIKVFIGNLQTNKIQKAIDLFDEIHSIDSLSLAQDLNNSLQREHVFMTVYLEINASGEISKHGFRADQIDIVMNTMKAFDNIKVKGFMTMAPFSQDTAVIRNVFKTTRTLADQYGLHTSMGMSNDWKIAVEEGSDMVRIGTKIFV